LGSLVGGILSSGAASQAGQEQYQAAQQASGLAGTAGQQAENYQTGQIANEGANASPYTTLGSTTANELTNALAPGGSLTQGWNQTFSAPTAAQAAATPGYQFQLQQGENALQNSAAARGGLLSTGTAKNLNNYAQGVASTNYQNTYNNALQTYNTNLGTFETNQNNLYNRLAGTTQLGANTVANLNNVQQQGTNALQSSILGTAQTQGQDIMGGTAALAAGQVGSANALAQGISGAAGAAGQGISLQGILGAQNASNSPWGNSAPSNDSGFYNGGNTAGTGFLPAASGAGLWGNNALAPQAPDIGNGYIPGQ
jgi:hypothetical protein